MTRHRAPRTHSFPIAALLALVAALLVASPARAVTPPVLTQLSSPVGQTGGGTFVTLHGHDLGGAYLVSFGSVHTSALHVWSSKEVTVRVPPHGAGRVSVRIAARHRASAASPAVTYTYVAQPARLAPTGATTPVPAGVSADVGDPVDTALSCASATFCAAVGTGGAATYDGTTWSALTAFGAGTTHPEVACSGSSFCLAFSGDHHTWRYDGATWTDLGDTGAMSRLSCGSSDLCGAIRASDSHGVLYRSGAWQPALASPDGSGGLDCFSATRCVSVDTIHYYLYDVATGGWSHPYYMWTTSALRQSTLTANIYGVLGCAGSSFCISACQADGSCHNSGSPQRAGGARLAVRNGSTWSIGHVMAGTGDSSDRQVDARLDCVTTTFCVKGDYWEDDIGLPFQNWSVLDGSAQSTRGGTPGTHQLADISCWAAYQCLGIGGGTSVHVTAG